MADEPKVFGPQPGPQTEFLSSPADIALYGGAAGGGKSFALLLEATRHIDDPNYRTIIFRRSYPDITNPGGLYDESKKIYPYLGGVPQATTLRWRFPSGYEVKFAHLADEHALMGYYGISVPLLQFDELNHFSSHIFFTMLARNRSATGRSKPYVRCTCNPDPTSWIRKFIDWWIGPDGFPIHERSGVLRWFIRRGDEVFWFDTEEDVYKMYGHGDAKNPVLPKSFTFIAASIYDNKILLKNNPEYLASLMALPRVERERLLGGNWDVKASAGNVFHRAWFKVIDALPAGPIRTIRFWDRAATPVCETNHDPDWTRGLKMLQYENGTYVVADLQSIRGTPYQVERLIQNTATQDGYAVAQWAEREAGSSGVGDANRFVTMLAGYEAHTTKPSTDKLTRARPVSAQAEAGNILVLKGSWNDEFFRELENFPEGSHDDIVDTLSGAFNVLAKRPSIFYHL